MNQSHSLIFELFEKDNPSEFKLLNRAYVTSLFFLGNKLVSLPKTLNLYQENFKDEENCRILLPEKITSFLIEF